MRFNREAFNKAYDDVFLMRPVRWWLFHRLSELGWWVCPEPHKSRLQAVMPQWSDISDTQEPPVREGKDD